VKPQRIRQESFGSTVQKGAQANPAAADTGVAIEFACLKMPE
jgi:hypothetical protein